MRNKFSYCQFKTKIEIEDIGLFDNTDQVSLHSVQDDNFI